MGSGQGGERISRRGLIGGGAALVALAGGAPARAATADQVSFEVVPMPEPVPAKEGLADVGGARLWFWDTGGDGEPVVLLHAGVGSGAFWGYQQPVLAKAGFRVIGYSRRGHFRSETGPADKPGIASEDLHALVEHLGLGRFHAVGTAAGGIYAADYALTRPDRLRSLTIACSLVTIGDEPYMRLSNSLRPKGFNEMPPEFRELGPSYRAANPEGTARWIALQKEAVHAPPVPAGPQPIPFRQGTRNKLTLAELESLKMPVMMMTGDADLYTPPTMLKTMADRVPHARVVIIDGAGHSAHWEQPRAFNKALLGFIGGKG